MKKKIVIRTRGIIINKGKLLVVKHRENDKHYALPGGHLEYGESIMKSLEREINEEFGIKPKVGELMFINNFVDKETQSIEFFFEILNTDKYLDFSKLKKGTHKNEICEILWMKQGDKINLLPKEIKKIFNSNKIKFNNIRFIN